MSKEYADFFEEIYKKWFGYSEKQNDGIIKFVEADKNYKETFDFYVIKKSIPKYLENKGINGLEVIIKCLNSMIKTNRIKKESIKVTFFFSNQDITFYEDRSYIWDSGFGDEVEILNDLFEYITDIQTTENKTQIINSFINNAYMASLWNRLIELFKDNLDMYQEEAKDILLNCNVLKECDDTYKIVGLLTKALLPNLSEEEQRNLEQNLLTVYNKDKNNDENSGKSIRAQRYIQLIGVEGSLILTETNEIFNDLKNKDKRLHKAFYDSSEAKVIESQDDFYKVRGIELSDEEQELLPFKKQLSDFVSKNLNTIPNRDDIENIIEPLKRLDTYIFDNQDSDLFKDSFMSSLEIICLGTHNFKEDEHLVEPIKGLLIKYSNVNCPSFDKQTSLQIDPHYYLNFQTYKNISARAMTYFYRSTKDNDIWDKLNELSNQTDDSSILWNIIFGIFNLVPFQTPEFFDLIINIIDTIYKNDTYKSNSELKNRIYFYTLKHYTNLAYKEKCNVILDKLEANEGNYKVFFESENYPTLGLYTNIYLETFNFERAKEKIDEFINDQANEKKLDDIIHTATNNKSSNFSKQSELLEKIFDKLSNSENDEVIDECIYTFLTSLHFKKSLLLFSALLPTIKKAQELLIKHKDLEKRLNSLQFLCKVISINITGENIPEATPEFIKKTIQSHIKEIIDLIYNTLSLKLGNNKTFDIMEMQDYALITIIELNKTHIDSIKEDPEYFKKFIQLIAMIAETGRPKALNFIYELGRPS